MEQQPVQAIVVHALDAIAPAPPVEYGGLTVTPLLGDDEPAAPYLTLDDALGAGLVEITEVSEAGRVPELRVRNRASAPVLIVDGEELWARSRTA